ncbi:hypothetical protein [Algoriphagus sp. A40]|uniref:hypothetical protein n=1 Tax=Algoriphagus sp. A40 TaxID=1945863 RepID=UPI000986F754|nr:hypothetical protein [Algoriphagus sp. A40]OOG77167.1 hypothetical protein B0E43_06110 [Algoriphagus sp. A40]
MKLIIAGANKLGEYLVETYPEFRLRHELIGFVDDNPKLQGKMLSGLPVLGTIESVMEMEKIAMVLAVQSPNEKVDVVRRLFYHPSLDFPNLFSSNAWVSKDCIFGKGNLILDGSLINFGTLIGDFNTISRNCSIGHETVISNYCYLEESVRFGGYSYLEEESVIGKEAVISQGVRIGREARISPGIHIIEDMLSDSKIK